MPAYSYDKKVKCLIIQSLLKKITAWNLKRYSKFKTKTFRSYLAKSIYSKSDIYSQFKKKEHLSSIIMAGSVHLLMQQHQITHLGCGGTLMIWWQEHQSVTAKSTAQKSRKSGLTGPLLFYLGLRTSSQFSNLSNSGNYSLSIKLGQSWWHHIMFHAHNQMTCKLDNTP